MSRSIVFDFGAVLFRWQPLALLQQVLPAHVPDEAAARALNAAIFQSFAPGSDWSQFDLGLVAPDPLAVRIGERTGLPTADVRRLIDAAAIHLQALPASVKLFHQLKAQGYRMFYLSNMPLSYAEHLEQVNPFIQQFDSGIFSSRVGLMKPWPALFQLAQMRFGLLPGDEVLFIDDHAGNIAAGQTHGWEGLRFEHAEQAEAELHRRGWLGKA